MTEGKAKMDRTYRVVGQRELSFKDIQKYVWFPLSVFNYSFVCTQGETLQAEHRTAMMEPQLSITRHNSTERQIILNKSGRPC